MVKRNLFYTLLTKYKSRSSKGVNSEKHLHNSMCRTKILHDAENCTFEAHRFNVKSVSPQKAASTHFVAILRFFCAAI